MSSAVKDYSDSQHNIILENRKKLVVSGVTEVLSFEEDSVELKTVKGNLFCQMAVVQLSHSVVSASL